MSLLDFFRAKSAPEVSVPTDFDNVGYGAAHYISSNLSGVLGQTPADLWRTQPHLRTVVTFLARNVAQLGLHTYTIDDQGDRARVRNHPVAQLLRSPNASMTGYELINGLVSDLSLYDNAYWLVGPDPDNDSGYNVQPIPSAWVTGTKAKNLFAVDKYLVTAPNKPTVEIDSARILHFHGWSPESTKTGTSPIEALRLILAEQMHAQAYRQQVWERGGRVGAVLTRPAGAPAWSLSAQAKFAEEWRAAWTGDDGPKAGGTPILQDGMALQSVRFSAKEEDFIDAAKLALATVAQVFHVNPTMVGQLDNATYSNVREFRKMLYGDTIGPMLAMIADRINAFLLPMVDAETGIFVEFNIQEKLEGSFEEQAQVMQTMVGAPVMTVDEGRARFNLKAMGGDAARLIVPLNVTVGGQASATDSAPKALISLPADQLDRALALLGAGPPKALGPGKARARPRRAKAASEPAEVDSLAEVLAAFFRRQGKTVQSNIGGGMTDYWDGERWDTELADDLLGPSMDIATASALATLAAAELPADGYSADQTTEFLSAVAASRARMINSATRDRVAEAVDTEDDPETPSVDDVFTEAVEVRAGVAAVTMSTMLASFGTVEAGKQTGGEVTKTWRVNSGNPRPDHAAMDGETVGIEDTFSNGANWPGDPVLDADGVAGCQCDVEVRFG